jgi:hypothetical protein
VAGDNTALSCGEECAELAGDLRAKLNDLLSAGRAPGEDPDSRRLMIGVLVARHLAPVVATSSGATVCRKPVTNRIYHFFLEDTAARGVPRMPDAPPRPLPDPDGVAAGVRADDAIAFVEWVNDVTKGHQGLRRYRMPRRGELDDEAVRAAVNDSIWRGLWRSPGAAPDAALTLGGRGPRDIPGAQALRTHLARDFNASVIACGIVPLLMWVRAFARMLRLPVFAESRAGELDTLVNVAVDCALDLAEPAERELATALILSASGVDSAGDALERAFVLDLDRLPRDTSPGGLMSDPAPPIAGHLTTAIRLAAYLEQLSGQSTRRLADAIGSCHVLCADLLSSVSRQRDAALLRCLADALTADGGSRVFLGSMGSRLSLELPGLARDVTPASIDRVLKLGLRVRDTLPIEQLAAAVHDTADKLHAALKDVTFPSAAWARQAAVRFRTLADPVVRRQQPTTASTARVLRLLALGLAEEADILAAQKPAAETEPLGDTFREIAATITWLERRHCGEDPPREAILLALES